MSKEFARFESAVHFVLAKPVAAVIYSVFRFGRWSVKRIYGGVAHWRCSGCSKNGGLARR